MKLRKDKVEQALGVLAGQAKVLVPTEVNGVKKFVPYEQGVKPDFDMVNTTLPPKDVLFPQTQKMYKYKQGLDPQVEEVVDSEKQIVFGIRPCDMASIDCLDLVFLTKTFVDSFYARKREELTTVAIGCTNSNETCFCTSMGQQPDAAPTADVMLAPTADGWNVTAQTEKGEALVASLGGLLEEGEAEALPAAVPSLQADMTGVAEKLADMFDHPMWDEIFRPCLTCGTCTFACPTCYCFEMETEAQGTAGGTEMRCWDSCMFSEYTRMAGGHNPRPSNKERVRNRYMHKLSFFEDRYGRSLCVGCGRCIEYCPVGLDITRVIDTARKAELVYATSD